MKRSAINPMPQFFDRYINLVEDIELEEAFNKYSVESLFKQKDQLIKLGDIRYAPDKWTVKDILQHIIDTERIISYRALRFSRNDKSILPGFDEELFGKTANAKNRTVPDLMEELNIVRTSSLSLFKSFNNEMLTREGISFNVNITVLALGFVIIGHPIHHLNVIKEKYYPLI